MAGFALDEQNSDCSVAEAGLAFFSRCNWFSCQPPLAFNERERCFWPQPFEHWSATDSEATSAIAWTLRMQTAPTTHQAKLISCWLPPAGDLPVDAAKTECSCSVPDAEDRSRGPTLTQFLIEVPVNLPGCSLHAKTTTHDSYSACDTRRLPASRIQTLRLVSRRNNKPGITTKRYLHFDR